MDLAELEDAIAHALEAQDFETASALRDRLAELRAEGNCVDRDGKRQVTPDGWTRALT